jgi:hypothetical protein
MKRSIFVIVAAALLAAPYAHAVLLAKDQFLIGTDPSIGHYTNAASLNGQEPATLGWPTPPASAWVAEALDATGNWKTEDGTLTYPSFLAQGGRLDITRGNAGYNWSLGFGREVIRISDQFDGLTEVWGSFLWRSSPGWDGGATLQIDSLLTITFEDDDIVGDGQGPDQEQLSFSGSFGGGAGVQALPSNTLSEGTTHLILFRSLGNFDDDEIDIWIDPDLSQGEPAQGSGDLSVVTNYRVNTENGVTLGNNQGVIKQGTHNGTPAGSTVSFDELHLGTTFKDVAPVPEPGTAALVLLAGLGVAATRRRR